MSSFLCGSVVRRAGDVEHLSLSKEEDSGPQEDS